MSLNDTDEIKELYSEDFNIQVIETRYTCTKGANPKAVEVLISNFELQLKIKTGEPSIETAT